MKYSILVIFWVTILFLSFLFVDSQDSKNNATSILFLTASSTVDACQEIADLYYQRSGQRVVISSGASNALAQQILAGVPADLFFSANPKWTQLLYEKELSFSPEPLLSNQLVVISNTKEILEMDIADYLLQPSIQRIALAGQNVPAGQYAQQALQGIECYQKLIESGKIVRGQSVRMALNFIQTGEAQVGIVYASDAHASQDVYIVHEFSSSDHDPIIYPIVMLQNSDRLKEVEDFHEFLLSPPALKVFEKHGFLRYDQLK